MTAVIDRKRLTTLLKSEQEKFTKEHPKSKGLFERAKGSMLGGVPMVKKQCVKF